MNQHELKTWPEYFQAVWDGRKGFELRKDDRGFQPGDLLMLREWSGYNTSEGYSGRRIHAIVTYMLDNTDLGNILEDDYSVLGIKVLARLNGDQEDQWDYTMQLLAKLREALEDFRDHGLRFDLNPTKKLPITGKIMSHEWAADNEAWWHDYIKAMDDRVRQRAADALEDLS